MDKIKIKMKLKEQAELLEKYAMLFMKSTLILNPAESFKFAIKQNSRGEQVRELIGKDEEEKNTWVIQGFSSCKKKYIEEREQIVEDYTDAWEDFLLKRVGKKSQLEILDNKSSRNYKTIENSLIDFVYFCKSFDENEANEKQDDYALALLHLQNAEEKKFVIKLEDCVETKDYINLRRELQDKKAKYLNMFHEYIMKFLEVNVPIVYNSNGEQVYEFDEITDEYYKQFIEDKQTLEEVFNYKLHRLDMKEYQNCTEA